ncbi:hypothetical protein EVAR_81498_1 [Eumeta japonica]|uniref:Uncharacterized protein n=1 Tax=Eumeta variegata TaxID=151549 RepID=A0A4C1W1M5_EUMVA|nr:hypothetical protein EVAR_81498_1 [Eumeta japonica]
MRLPQGTTSADNATPESDGVLAAHCRRVNYTRSHRILFGLTSRLVINRCTSRASRHSQPRAQSILKHSSDAYAEEPLEGTHRIVTHRRHLHAERPKQAA